jgi:hypothetical protein
MKKIIIVVAGMLALTTLALAQDDDFKGWMKTIGGSTGGVKKNLEAQNFEGAVTDARKIEGAFKQVAAYWEDKKDGAAVELARTGQDAAAKVVASASIKDSEQATMALKVIQGTCHGCHEAHREKLADGTFKIK